MISLFRSLRCAAAALSSTALLAAPSINQTSDISPIYAGDLLPFTVTISEADFQLPQGWHSGVTAIYKGKWLLFAGRSNGLHGFNNNDDNFPPQQQNSTVYVVDPEKQKVYQRILLPGSSGLTSEEINSLTVTSPQFYQEGKTLYITGGYGVDRNGNFSTKPILTAVDIPGLIHWVVDPRFNDKASAHIRQISDPIFQVTGGYMTKIDNHATLLVFGQNFAGFYEAESNGQYIQQVRRFRINDNGRRLSVKIEPSLPEAQDPNYRRRDLNVLPCIHRGNDGYTSYLTAFSGVFTEAGGIWTVPVSISASGKSHMADPSALRSFKQGMNNYVCATAGLYSKGDDAMYNLFFGGLSYGYFNNQVFTTDPEIPFINQSTAIKCNHRGEFKQYLLNASYPVIISPVVNAGNPYLFGAGAAFIPAEGLPSYDNGVLKLDKLPRSPTLIGYIVGGIQSTLPDTNTMADSTASAYIFKVELLRR